jgi:glutamate-ammonia-ligase adenylyltransferase
MSSFRSQFDDALGRAQQYSPFLAQLLRQEPELAAALPDALSDPLAASQVADPSVPLSARLRRERRRLALLVAVGDLAGVLDFRRATLLLSDFADHALHRAIAGAVSERVPDAEPAGFTAIALGKQGSRELNYSSDIDPILLFDPETLPRNARDEPEQAAVRIARRVLDLLQTRDGDGYVLRVDLRLRPSPEVTPIALPVSAAIGYYESQALAWERAAFIRSRACAGDVALGERFLTTIRPFIWRRSLDFGAIEEIRGISRRIRDHHAAGQRLGPGYDLKRGRGGIREIEFFAQIHQLIHGGRDPALRAPATLDALAALAKAGRIDPDVADTLTEAYVLLRTIEHRVQMVDDRQTHQLPTQPDALDNVARLHGLSYGAELIDLLQPQIERVGTIYDALDDRPTAVAVPKPVFPDAEQAERLVAGWRSGRYPALKSAPAQAALEAVLPQLLPAIATAAAPGAAMARLDAMLARLPTAVNVLRLLAARPPLVSLLAAILASAPTLADELARRADLLDGLLDASAFEPAPAVEALVTEMRRGEAGDDYQAVLDRVRRIVGERRFALGTQIVAGAADPLEVAAGYARLAEAAVEVLTSATVSEFARAHGQVPGSELIILALGRLGGRALTHASDLDLIYLFTGDFAAESDGAKPLGAVLYYNRLAQRLTAALSVPTASGPLYAVDTRLRPSGAQGPLVVSTEAFARYQRESAWTWEHMALTRARPIFGSAAGRGEVQGIVDRVLGGDRPRRDVAAEARAMRAEMAAHKPPAGPLDAKLLPGGLVDLEFAVHTLQLVHRTGFAPELATAITALAEQAIVPQSLAHSYQLLARLLVTMRLVAPDAQPPAGPVRQLVATALALPDWDAVLDAFAAARQEVTAAWQSAAGE